MKGCDADPQGLDGPGGAVGFFHTVGVTTSGQHQEIDAQT